MARAELAVDEPGTVADEDNRQRLVADVDLDLLEDTHRHEGGEAIDDGAKPGLGETGRHADHVLLGDAAVDVLPGTVLPELVEQRIAMVAGKEK
jgi:hypothetical protein